MKTKKPTKTKTPANNISEDIRINIEKFLEANQEHAFRGVIMIGLHGKPGASTFAVTASSQDQLLMTKLVELEITNHWRLAQQQQKMGDLFSDLFSGKLEKTKQVDLQ
jgi:hypothetical protein